MGIPTEFYTIESFATLTGATSIVLISTNALNYAFNLNPRFIALFLSILISYIGLLSKGLTNNFELFIGLFNGFLIYCTAIGASQITGRRKSEAKATFSLFSLSYKKIYRGKKHFFIKWF